MVNYRSKVNVGIIVALMAIILVCLFIMIIAKVLFGIIIIGFVAWFLYATLLHTNYTINGNTLIIKAGFIYVQSINIHSITKIEETNNMFTAPAASIDRLAVSYNKYDRVVISPLDKAAFISHLLTINPHITVIYKKA